MMKRVLASGLLTMVLAFSGMLTEGAAAHPAGDYYPKKWQGTSSVNWGFTEGFPDNDFRQRVKGAADTWNDLNPNLHFDRQTGDYNDFSATNCPGTYQKDGIHIGNIDGQGGTWAFTVRCWFTGTDEMHSFQIKFDDDENWYKGTGDPTSQQLDALAVSTHEFGHATGFKGPFANGHFDPDASLCTDNPEQTMCPFIEYGQQFMRTLESHDQHTFGNAY